MSYIKKLERAIKKHGKANGKEKENWKVVIQIYHHLITCDKRRSNYMCDKDLCVFVKGLIN